MVETNFADHGYVICSGVRQEHARNVHERLEANQPLVGRTVGGPWTFRPLVAMASLLCWRFLSVMLHEHEQSSDVFG